MRASTANRVATFTQSGLGPREGFTVVGGSPAGRDAPAATSAGTALLPYLIYKT